MTFLSTRAHTTRAVAGVCLAASVPLLATACSGPTIGVSIGGKSVPIDVAFGKPSVAILEQVPTATGPAPGTLVPVPGGGLGVIPVTGSDYHQALNGTFPTYQSNTPVRTIPAPSSCPSPPPGSASRSTAGELVTGTPPPGVYPVHFSSETSTAGKDSKQSGTATFTVDKASTSPGGGTSFSVVTDLLGQRTTFDYYVQPPAFDTATPAGQAPGGGMIALTQVTGSGGYGYQASFHPSTGLELLALPAFIGSTWQQEAADASSGTTASVNGQVQSEVPVQACAALIDTRESNATITTSSQNENITTTVQTYFATQYGGLPVQETESFSGTAGGVQVSGALTWTYEVDPGAPRS